jgi:hypothetical protein
MADNACDGRPMELARAVLCLDELSKDISRSDKVLHALLARR